MIRDFIEQLKRQDLSAHAACMAFFLFLSLVPMLIVVCAILPYTSMTEANLVNIITRVTPDVTDEFVTLLISEVYYRSAGVLSIAILVTIWSAAKGVLAMIRGLNAVYEVKEKRNYFVLRFVACFYMLIMIFVLILVLFVNVFGNRLVNLTLHNFPALKNIISFVLCFRFAFVWGILTIIFAAVYAFCGYEKLKFRDQIPGATMASIVWTVYSYFFSMYVDSSGILNIYGSLAVIVLVMMWMYFGMYILLLGANLNRFLMERIEK